MRLFFSRYIKVECPNGPRYILKKPDKAFSLVAPDWKLRTKSMVNFFNKAQGQLEIELANRTKSIVKNLTDNFAALQAHYQAAYIAFTCNPCSEKFEKAFIEANSEIREKEYILREVEVETRKFSELSKKLIKYKKQKLTSKTKLSKSPKRARQLEKIADAKKSVHGKMTEIEELVSELGN